MAWDDSPPTPEQLAALQNAPAPSNGAGWDSKPPTPQQLAALRGQAPSPSPSMSDKASAFLSGVGQGGLMGYLPQVQAAVEGLLPNPSADVDAKLKAQGFTIKQPEQTFVQRRDQFANQINQQAAQSPGYYAGGQLAGAIGTAPLAGKAFSLVPGLAVGAEAPGLIKGTLQAAGGGALQGALQNPGDTPGKLSGLQTNERLGNAAVGGMVGGAMGAVGSAVKGASDYVFNTPARLDDWAALKRAKATGMMLKDYKAATARSPGDDPEKRIIDIGNAMIKGGVGAPGDNIHDIATQSFDLKQKAGSVIGDVYNTAQKQADALAANPDTPQATKDLLKNTSLDPANWSKELSQRFGGVVDKDTGEIIQKGELTGKPGGKVAMNAVQSTLDELAQNGNGANIRTVQDFKSGVDNLINYNKRFDDSPLKNEYLFKVRDFLSDKIQGRVDALDKALGSNKLESLKEANHQYGIWTNVNNTSQAAVNREMANRFMSPTDYASGVGGMFTGAAAGVASGHDMESRVRNGLMGAAGGALLGPANNLLRRYGNSITSGAASTTANAIRAIPGQGAIKAGSGLLGKLGTPAGGAAAARIVNPPGYNQ